MSGAFGWHKGNATQDATQASPGYFNTPQPSVAAPSVTVKKVGQTRVPTPISTPTPRPTIHSVMAAQTLSVPDGRHSEKTTGEVVIVGVLDVTVSMSHWPEEIFKRLPRLYQVACDYFGTAEVDVLFIAHGDARTDHHSIQVGRVSRGQALEIELASFDRTCGGGGQGSESQEIVAAYLRDCLDTSSARQVYTFFVTDEAACAEIDPRLVMNELGIDVTHKECDTGKVFTELATRMSLYTVLCTTQCYGPREQKAIRAFWDRVMPREHILPLDDARRVVETMLGVFAKTTGQIDRFTKDLASWHMGSPHGAQNVKTVLTSIALVGGQGLQAPKILPKTMTRPLLPSGSHK